MSLSLPDKWVRKAVSDVTTNLVVNSVSIPTFDSHTVTDDPSFYILMTTQTNNELDGSKCGRRFASSILLDIVTRYEGAGNIGSRLFVDDIADAVLQLTSDLVLDVASGLKVTKQRNNFPNDITTNTGAETIFRKLLRIEIEIDKI